MKICMLGSGSLGSAIGGTLAEFGNEVYLVDQWKEHIDEINSKGLLLIDGNNPNHKRYVNTKAQTNFDKIPEVDLVIVLVKSFATKSAVKQAKQSAVIGKNTLVMSLQNGIGNEEAIISIVGEKQVIGGKTYVGGAIQGAGATVATTVGKMTYIGEINGEITPRILEIAKKLTESGISTKVMDNIKGLIWDKLLINVAAGALCGVTGLPYGGLYDTYGHEVPPELKKLGMTLVNEAIEVAKVQGIILETEDAKTIWYKCSQGLPESFKTSILQSLEKNSITEVEFINGAVVELGRKFGVATPANEAITACVKGIEYRNSFYKTGKYEQGI